MTAIDTVTDRQTGGDTGSAAPTSAQADAFNAAADGGTPAALTVSGNTIDTGRYVITGSNGYTRPNDGIRADDGMVTITDKVTNTFVDVFGDPHVYTSDGDRAEFQKDGLRIDLADGTRIEFKPTAQTNGFSHIDAVSVTKGDRTVVERGFYAADGSARVTTAPLRGDGASPAAGFGDPNATVMTTAPGGGLNTLVNARGIALSDKVNQTALDGMGGASPVSGTISPQLVALLQKLVTLLQQQVAASTTGTAGSGALMSGDTPGRTARPIPGQDAGSAPGIATSGATSVPHLIGLLRALLPPSDAEAIGPAPASMPPTTGPADGTELLHQVASLLQRLVTALSGSAAGAARAGKASDLGGLARQLIPELEQVADTAAPGGTAPGSTAATQGVGTPATQAAGSGPSAGSGPNTMLITDAQDHAITVGKFENGESTTDPSASITLQPGQTGALLYANGEAGFAAQADAGGTVQPDASRLEYEADKDGTMKYPDVSYIDGRNASITLTDGAGLTKGDGRSIAADAPAATVTLDSAGNRTVAGWYDGSTATMQAGGAYMQAALGTSGAYLHPDDDRLPADRNPMSATRSTTIKASFGEA